MAYHTHRRLDSQSENFLEITGFTPVKSCVEGFSAWACWPNTYLIPLGTKIYNAAQLAKAFFELGVTSGHTDGVNAAKTAMREKIEQLFFKDE